MLKFSEWAQADRAEAERYVESLLEIVKSDGDLTVEQKKRMMVILESHPDILNAGRKVMYVGMKRKRPDLEYLDRK